MAKKQVSAQLARIARDSKIIPPKVNPRVTPQRALQLLTKTSGGARLLQRLKAMGEPVTLTQIAYFTPRTWTGNVGFVDFYNAELRAWFSGVTNTYQNDIVYFGAAGKTAYDDISLKHPNGVVQAFFHLEEKATVLVVAKLSSAKASVYLVLDSRYGDSFDIEHNGDELSILKERGPGVHRVNIIQRTKPKNPIWFHSITVFTI